MAGVNGSVNGKTLNISDSRFAEFRELVDNVISSRSELWRKFLDPRRDIATECGHPKSISAENYRDFFDRNDIAARVVNLFPSECFKVQPSVFEDADTESVTEFEDAWDELGKSLRTEDSYYQDEEGNPVWEALERADVVSGIGHYGVLLLGLDDGKEMREKAGKKKDQKLMFLRCFDETLAKISRFEDDPKSPRFGHPLEYLITFNDPRDIHQAGIGMTTATKQVHWSRVIHLADNLLTAEIFGLPRMQQPFNRLQDIQKLLGGSAEMYWRGAFPGISIESHPQLGGDVTFPATIRDDMEQYMNGLQRYLALAGVAAKTLAPQVVDPTAQLNAQIEAICIMLGCPVRIFKGSERGELASSQDEREWQRRVRRRQTSYLTPRVIVPFVDRLINLGVLPEPEGYSVEWPDMDAPTPSEKATVASVQTEAMSKYASGGVETIMAPMDFLTRILGFDEDDAKEIIDGASEHVEEKEAADMEKQQTMIDEGLMPDPTKPPPPGAMPGGGPPKPGMPPGIKPGMQPGKPKPPKLNGKAPFDKPF